jgi:hypothetical protein
MFLSDNGLQKASKNFHFLHYVRRHYVQFFNLSSGTKMLRLFGPPELPEPLVEARLHAHVVIHLA